MRQTRKMSSSFDDGNRGKIKFLNIIFTCLILLSVGVSTNDTFIRKLNKIGENLDKALSIAMDVKQPNYTDININVTYNSDTNYNPKGLGELYNITKSFMKLILKDAIPKNVFSIHNNQLEINLKDNWFDLIVQYSFILLICLIVIILGAVMPVCGVFFCCCRCCGKCGARSRPYDKKHDLCRRFYLASLLIVCGTLLLFGVVCAFVTNQRLTNGVEEFPDNIKISINDTNKFLINTNNQVDILLIKNFDEFYKTINESLDNCSIIVFEELEQISNATSMDDISDIAVKFPTIRDDYVLLKNSTNDLRIYASQLNDAVRRIKRDLLDILRNCVDKYEQCNKLNNDIGRLKTNVDFDKLPDMNLQIDELDKLLEQTNISDILKGKEKLKKIQTDIQKAVKDNTDKAKEKIGEAGRTVAKNSRTISKDIKELSDFLTEIQNGKDGEESIIDQTKKIINQLDPYRQYVGLGICSILLLITVFVALGLICGICGKRPGGYGDDCCNKGSGSQFLLCGVMFMFFFTYVIAITTLIYFLIGMATQEGVCKSLKNPKTSHAFELIDKLNLTSYGIESKLSDVITKCHQNQTVYNVFDLKKRFDIDQIHNYIDDFDIEKALNALNKTTSTIDFDNFHILYPKQLKMLENIANSDFANVDFQKFLDELSANFTNIDLSLITKELEIAIEKVQDHRAIELSRKLESVLVQLHFYERNVVKPMKDTANKVLITASNLDKNLRLGHDSFKDGMEDLINKVIQAQNSLRKQGPKMIQDAAADFASKIISQVKKYLDRVVKMTKEDVGKCGPLSNVFNATLITTCDKVALQMNGFWFTLFCSMLVFLPTIVISVKLAILYQKQVPFSDYYVETGRGGGAGKDKRKKKGKRRDDRTPRSGNAELAPRDIAGGSAHQETRNWEEFPAGGPPQYQRAPTEYERPPPYYYPGTNATPSTATATTSTTSAACLPPTAPSVLE